MDKSSALVLEVAYFAGNPVCVPVFTAIIILINILTNLKPTSLDYPAPPRFFEKLNS